MLEWAFDQIRKQPSLLRHSSKLRGGGGGEENVIKVELIIYVKVEKKGNVELQKQLVPDI